jgi:glycosyltransferase involved in cell wall biosynthesis
MKIAYVVYLRYISEEPGVYQKLQQQKRASDALDLGIDFFLLSEENTCSANCAEQGIQFIQLQKISNPLVRHYNYTKQLIKIFNDYEVLIWRHVGFTPQGWYNLRKKPFKLITEHHTKEIDEALTQKLIGKMFLDLLSAKANFYNIDGVIGVTNEIKIYQIRRGFTNSANSIAISNGIDVNSISFTSFQPFNEKALKMVFVASCLSKWHGIDRLIKSANEYRGSIELHLNIVGRISRDELVKSQPENIQIKLHGLLYGDDLDNLMGEMNLAIGSLAVHRNNLREACVLKVREYTARGLPFIYAYDDIDLTNNLHFCKKLPANDQPIDMNMLVNFSRELSNNYIRDELSSIMRDYALNNMDWKSKMKAYRDFAEKVYIG